MNAIGWSPFNSDESSTLHSSKVSFYKGVPIFRTAAGSRSGSFGAIFLIIGSCRFTRSFLRYDDVPEYLVAKNIKEYKTKMQTL